jgi:hypothetical protein
VTVLWEHAGLALTRADEVVIIGYSLPDADTRARELLFTRTNKAASVTVCCSGATTRIQDEFRREKFLRVQENRPVTFELWLDSEAEASPV